jgi:3-methyladenine DNA glycosylase AlkD
MTYKEITDHLHSLADTERAISSQRYFKTGEGEYGYGDVFIGIRMPVLREAVKKFRDTPIGVAEKLLRSEYHEIRMFSLLILVYRFSRKNDKEKEEIYNIYLSNTQYINNWDLVDSSAHHIVGAYLENREKTVLYDFALSDSLWERRIAVISTFHYIKKNIFKDALSIAELLLYDREDLIHKAVGWMLREIGNRDLDIETRFLKFYYSKMPRTALRYAIEKFSKEERWKYLNGEI